jgi:hypothetical protein
MLFKTHILTHFLYSMRFFDFIRIINGKAVIIKVEIAKSIKPYKKTIFEVVFNKLMYWPVDER